MSMCAHCSHMVVCIEGRLWEWGTLDLRSGTCSQQAGGVSGSHECGQVWSMAWRLLPQHHCRFQLTRVACLLGGETTQQRHTSW